VNELPLPGGSPGGMEAFRCSLTASFFFKFYLTVRLKLEQRWVSGLASFFSISLCFIDSVGHELTQMSLNSRINSL